MPEVQIISATWCKRCHAIKPEVAALCVTAGATLTVVDYDELEDDDPVKKSVTALPTIRMRSEGDWVSYTPADLDKWKTDVAALAAAPSNDTDF
jgi:hypothetical protein